MDELTVYGWREFWLGLAQLALPCAINIAITWASLRRDGARPPRVLALLSYALLVVAGGGLAIIWNVTATMLGSGINLDPFLLPVPAILILGVLAARRYFQCGWPAAAWIAIWGAVCAWFAGMAAAGVRAVPGGY